MRRLFMVLSPRSLSYARLALDSLYRNCVDHFALSLITDSQDDVVQLEAETERLQIATDRKPRIYGDSDLLDIELEQFAKFGHIRNFRRGHPCWRKITDPILLSDDHEEIVVLDPDLYFPNRFRFERTPDRGVLLMWQRPSCLLPPDIVEAAINANVSLAHHTDIGVAQWRMPIDLEWLNWLIGKLGSADLPRSMHVESIVWAAIAMRIGGGYLDPEAWVCWHRSQLKRVLIKLGASGPSLLRRESLVGVKCFHAGGQSKWWLPEAGKLGILDQTQDVTAFTELMPYQEIAPSKYRALQRNRRWLRKLGYYSLLGNT